MSESILPFAEPSELTVKAVRRAKEWAWDFKSDDFLLKDKKLFLVYDDEAIKIWLYKLLKTERYRELIHSWTYGAEIKTLIGTAFNQGYVRSEAERFIREAVEENLADYIKSIEIIKLSFNNTALEVVLKLDTIYSKGVETEYAF